MKKYYAYDVETTGFNPYLGAEMFAYSIANEVGEPEVYRLDGADKKANEHRLEDFWADTSIAKVGHNMKFDFMFTKAYGIDIPTETELHDTLVMSQLLQNLHNDHSLAGLCEELFDYPTDNDVLVKKYTRGRESYQTVPKHIMDAYQEDDAIRTMLLFQLWYAKHIKGSERIYNDYLVEMELIKVAIRQQEHGIMLHRDETDKMIRWLEDELANVYERLDGLVGERINLRSSRRVADLLFNTLKLQPKERTKTGWSTDRDTLFALREEESAKDPNSFAMKVLNLISKHRSYTRGLPITRSYIDYADKDGIVHCNINTNIAKTGRQSVTKPPLQGVGKEESLLNPYPVPARRCFRARPGYVLYMPDYSGIEMRLCTEEANERDMINIFKEGKNPHEVAAKIFYGDRFISKKITKALYDAAKNGHFAIPYGASAAKLAETLGITVPEAIEALGRYGIRFRRIAKLSRTVSVKARRLGYVETVFGRRLEIPRDALHASINYLIQGTAAQILKRAQVRIDRYLREEWDDRIYLILPVHDELFIEYPRKLFKHRHEVFTKVTELMTDFPEFEIPLEVGWKMTYTTWSKTEEIDINQYRLAA